MNQISVTKSLLTAAIAIKEASLVIFRHGVLVEFKTTRLPADVIESGEGPHRSWQVGAFRGHHCHLDLGAVHKILFDAEPVSCQGGRLNYTVWFLGERDCGNPYRGNGLFSVTLNRPYRSDGSSRQSVIRPVYRLHQSFREHAMVSATDAFVQAGQKCSFDHARQPGTEVGELRMFRGPDFPIRPPGGGPETPRLTIGRRALSVSEPSSK